MKKTVMIFAKMALLTISGVLLAEFAWAQGGGGPMSIATVADNVTKSLTPLTKLITACAYIAGIGFSIGAIMKFKQHKDNPTQIPVGTPVAMVFIAAALLFLPTVLSVTGGTLFGGTGKVAGPSGVVFKVGGK